nr:hypothetical protein [Paraburkholderia bannensis]
MLRLRQRAARFGQQHLACRGQPHALTRARKQRAAHFVFEIANLHAQRRLHDVQPLCGLAEMAGLGQCHEIA